MSGGRRCRRLAVAACAVAAGIVLAGCSRREMGPVTGRVTHRGQPVAAAVVQFLPSNGPMAAATTDAAGRFQLRTFGTSDGALTGTHTVVVVPWFDEMGAAENQLLEELVLPERPDIPAVYRQPHTSPLTAAVTSRGPNEFEFALDAANPPPPRKP
jgi:hypothetical protein